MQVSDTQGNDFDYRLFFDAAAEGMLLATVDGTVLDANREACELLRSTHEEVLGAGHDGIFDPSDPRMGPAFEKLRGTGRFEGELKLRRQDGTAFPAEVSIAVYQGDTAGVVFRDITERKRTEETPHLIEGQFKALVENALDWISICNPDNTFRYLSSSTKTILGYEPEELEGVFVPSLIHPDDLEPAAKEAERIVVDTARKPRPIRYRHKDGSWVYLEGVFSNRIEDPSIRGIICNLRDVTERVLAEEALKESEEWFRALVQNAPDLTIVVDAEVVVRYISPSVERLWGYKPEEIVGTAVTDYFHPEDLELALEAYTRAVNDPSNEGAPGPVVRVRHKDGFWRYMEGFANNLLDNPHVRGLVFNSRDVTERMRSEEALREGEQLFRSSFEDAAIGMALVAPDGHWLRVNHALCSIVGYPEQELLSKTFQEIIHPDNLSTDLDYVQKLLSGEIRTFQMEKRYLHKDGYVVWILLSVSLVRDAHGEPLYFIPQIQDITERKWAEERLRQAETRYRTLVERMPAVVYIQEIGSPDSAMYMSPQIEALTGYSPEECKDPDLRWRMVHPDDREQMRAEDERTGEPGEVFTTEYRVVHRDGRTVWVRNESVLVEEAAGGSRYWQGFMIDITERKQAEEVIRCLNEELEERVAERTAQLVDRERRLKKLVGKVVAAQEEERRKVAYEIHDGLAQVATAAHQRLQAFASKHPPGSVMRAGDLDRPLELAQLTVKEARKVIEGLRPTVLDDFGLVAALRQMVEEFEMGEGLKASYEEALGQARLPDEVETALYRVAQEALNNVRKHARTGEARVTLACLPGKVRLEVKDEGRGFDPSVASRQGWGPGERVGLSSMRERVSLLGGELRVASKPGAGTSITAEVPLPQTT